MCILALDDGRIWEYETLFGTTLKKGADHESHIQDSSTVRVHQHACRAFCKTDQVKENMGKSVGGRTTKIHAVVDGLGYPLEVRLTEGQVHDATQWDLSLKGAQAEFVICDKAYDSGDFGDSIAKSGSKAVIPSKKNRKEEIEYDTHMYKERHLIENFFCKIKEYRRLATRYDATACSFRAFVVFAAI